MVPVGGAIAASSDKKIIEAIGKVYPGRASGVRRRFSSAFTSGNSLF
jgi:hypothetical protein